MLAGWVVAHRLHCEVLRKRILAGIISWYVDSINVTFPDGKRAGGLNPTTDFHLVLKLKNTWFYAWCLIKQGQFYTYNLLIMHFPLSFPLPEIRH